MANDVVVHQSEEMLQEISMQLEQSHLGYLQMDETPQKLEQRRKLEGLIQQYLCHVPNENKYVFQETADILHRSAATLQDFSGYRAATAWSAISLYAANLVAQPWRKEYRTLRTYSGYYKHEVEANLVGAELMFEQMGYKHTDLGTLYLDGPIDPDKVTSVSRDAIVAFVECQILKQIWEAVSQGYSISWLEVLQFREKCVGSPEQAIRALKFCFLEKCNQSRSKLKNLKEYHYSHPTVIDAIPSSLPHRLASNNYPLTPLPHPCQSDYRYIEDINMVPKNNQYFHPIEYSMSHRCSAHNCSTAERKYNGRGNLHCSISSSGRTKVPTDRLIELDTPVSTHHNKLHHHHYRRIPNRISDFDEVDFHRSQFNGANPHFDYGKVEKRISKSTSTLARSCNDSWDYAYSNSENLGYIKDFEDREDILYREDSESRIPKHKQSRSNEYDRHERRKSGRIEVNDIDASMTNGRNFNHEASFSRKSSSFDLSESSRSHTNNNISESLSNLHICNSRDNKYGSQTLSLSCSHQSPEQIIKLANSLKDLSQSDSRIENNAKEQEEEESWSCATCTFFNSIDREICEMCNKSKNKGNEDKPLASGGKECPECTLVNERNVAECEACGASLKDSPTYI